MSWKFVFYYRGYKNLQVDEVAKLAKEAGYNFMLFGDDVFYVDHQAVHCLTKIRREDLV